MLCAIAAAACSAPAPRENCTITVHEGARQVFKGFGVGQSLWDAQQGYAGLPDSVRDTLARFLWHDLNFRYLRLRSTVRQCTDTASDCAGSVFDSYDLYVRDARKYQDSLVLLLAPHGEIGDDLDTYARKYAYQIKALRDTGLVITYTGISNEPDWENLLDADQIPELIRAFRRHLDSLGLTDVRIVAPENSSADWKAQEFVDSILADPAATSALDAFATHSYNWSITEDMNGLVEPYVLGGAKEYWMTEASEFGTEQWEDAKEASSALSRYFADMNHLCNVWFFYVGIKGVESDWRMSGNKNTAFYMILYRAVEQDWGYLLKSWYFKAASQAIDPYAVFRKSTTNLRRVDSTKYWRTEDSTMVYAFGRKAPLYLGAAVNPDGSWCIGVTNYTGEVLTTPITEVLEETVYDITVKVEELVDSGDIEFSVTRCNADTPYVHEEGTVSMQDGLVQIDSLGSFDMITMRSPSGTVDARGTALPSLPPGPSANGLRLTARWSAGSRHAALSFDVPRETGMRAVPITIRVYDVRGRLVAIPLRRLVTPGTHTVHWNGRGIAGGVLSSGVYAVRAETIAASARARMVIGR
ncbi:MAG: hypothetical protein GF418_09755 [Chitinivibrionales bacterium]|nr:hypothetical protein [Chitinivibrionales bacterium]